MEYSVVVKNKKYLKGRDFALGNYTYSWTSDIKEAWKFELEHSDADHFAKLTNGKIKDIKQS
jgi:hypothetical protein